MSKQIVNKENIIIPEGTMEDFQRPNHPDFMDTSELIKAKFSGLRHNTLSDEAELWVLGSIVERVTRSEVQFNPLAINEAYQRAFALEEVMPDTPAARAYIAYRNKNNGDG